MASAVDCLEQTERALLGCVLLSNELWPQTGLLCVDDFSLDSHRRMFAAIAAMFEGQQPVDLVTLTAELARLNALESCGGAAYVSSLLDQGIPENFDSYAQQVRRAAVERRVARQIEVMAVTSGAKLPDRLARLREQAQELQSLLTESDLQTDGWKSLFHTFAELMNVPPVRFAIDGFLQEDGITLIGGLAGHGKTLCMLAMARALLEGGKLFHHFAVNKPAERVIYLTPEAGLAPFSARLKTFRLESHVSDGRLFCRTLSSPGQLSLTDPRLLAAVKGADVFLDTAIRFMVGDENSATEQKVFAETLFGLQRAGARTITGAHHSPKSFGKDSVMTLENILRGSGDIGAMLSTCWGVRQIDAESNRIYVQNVKPRDFRPCEPFIIQGRPSLDATGYFDLTEGPGFAGELGDHVGKDRGGRPALGENKIGQALRLNEEGKSQREIAVAVGVSAATVNNWISRRKKVQ